MNQNAYFKASLWASLLSLVFAVTPLQAQNAYYGGYGNQGFNGNQGLNGNYFVAPPRVYVAPGWGSRGLSYVTVPTPTMQSQMLARNFFVGGGIALGGTNQAGAALAFPTSRVAARAPFNQRAPLERSRAPLLAGRP